MSLYYCKKAYELNKGNSSISLSEIHKLIEKKTNPGYSLKLRETQ